MFKKRISTLSVAAVLAGGLIAPQANAFVFGDPITLSYSLSDGTVGSVTFDLMDEIANHAYVEGFKNEVGDTSILTVQDTVIGYQLNGGIVVDPNLNTKYEITGVLKVEDTVIAANPGVDADFVITEVYEWSVYFDDLTDGGTISTKGGDSSTGYVEDFVLMSTTATDDYVDASGNCPGVSTYQVTGVGAAGSGSYTVCLDQITGSTNAAVASISIPEYIQFDGELETPADAPLTTVMYDGTAVSAGVNPDGSFNTLFNVDNDTQFAVPAPSTVALMGLSLALMGGIARRGRKKA